MNPALLAWLKAVVLYERHGSDLLWAPWAAKPYGLDPIAYDEFKEMVEALDEPEKTT